MIEPTPDSVLGPHPTRLWRGVPVWELALGAFRARFSGAGSPRRDGELASWLAPEVDDVAWLHQCHSDRVLDAEPGLVGDGDALVVRGPRLAAAVAIADCVPVIAIGESAGAVIHAGWRGIVAGIVPRALARLDERVRLAWIGPAIGACCYEVGPEVADAVVAASGDSALAAGVGARPHLDLRQAVATQLAAAGVVVTIELVDLCTRCHPELLASYRRDGERAGRNLAILWREG